MTIRDLDDTRIANLRACIASISAKAERAAADEDTGCRQAFELIRDICEVALKADERAGGKLD